MTKPEYQQMVPLPDPSMYSVQSCLVLEGYVPGSWHHKCGRKDDADQAHGQHFWGKQLLSGFTSEDAGR